jgi:hypothetical protein
MDIIQCSSISIITIANIITMVFETCIGWFDGLSNKFLATRAAKLLILAGTDRLDKPLTIGHIQGTSNHTWHKYLSKPNAIYL